MSSQLLIDMNQWHWKQIESVGVGGGARYIKNLDKHKKGPPPLGSDTYVNTLNAKTLAQLHPGM